jgi:hypothetical protein
MPNDPGILTMAGHINNGEWNMTKSKEQELKVYEVWGEYTGADLKRHVRAFYVVAYSAKGAGGFVKHFDPDVYKMRVRLGAGDSDDVVRAFLDHELTAEEGSVYEYEDTPY